MSEKFRFDPVRYSTIPSVDSLEKLNRIHALYRACQESGFSDVDAAGEFYRAVDGIFEGKRISELGLSLIEISGDV